MPINSEKKIKATRVILMLILFAFTIPLFTGCDVATISVDNMLVPPKLSGELDDIYGVFVNSIDKEVKLKYPKTGMHKSAITLINIDDEESDEAVIFYEIPSTTTENYTLRVNILDKIDNEWTPVYNLGVEAVGVDKFSVVATQTDTYLVVGFTTIGTAKSIIKIYSFENKQLVEQFSQSCSTHEIIDINSDGADELILFVNKKLENDINENTAVMVSTVATDSLPAFSISKPTQLDPDVSDYLSISKGNVNAQKGQPSVPALYIDGLKGNGVISTQILISQTNKLSNLIFRGEKTNPQLLEETSRSTRVSCSDLNGDNILEIPKLYPFVNYTDTEKHNQLFYTQWNNFVQDGLQVKHYSYSDFSLNFMVMLKEEWIDKITVTKDTAENLVTFFYFNSVTQNATPLFEIKTIHRADYKNSSQVEASISSYELLETNGQISYMYKFYPKNSNIKITPSDLKDLFRLLL